jgi:hypothetical protein
MYAARVTVAVADSLVEFRAGSIRIASAREKPTVECKSPAIELHAYVARIRNDC